MIYPRVVGSSIGLPGIWVLAAIMIGSGLGGVVGMLVGVPISAAAYKILRDATSKKLQEKGIVMETVSSESGASHNGKDKMVKGQKKSTEETKIGATKDADTKAEANSATKNANKKK